MEETPGIDAIRYSPCERDHTMYRAIGSVSFVNASGTEGDNKAYWDNLSGKPLNARMVQAARLEELGELAKNHVYDKVPISECWNRTGQAPVGTRWVDVNKGMTTTQITDPDSWPKD